MAKFLVWELSEVTAKTAEEAAEKAKSKKKSVAFAAPSLKELIHPVHLQESVDMFGHVGTAHSDVEEPETEEETEEDTEAEGEEEE